MEMTLQEKQAYILKLRPIDDIFFEVQRSNDDDHLRRVRFNASSITVKDSYKGQKFSEIPDVIVVYISEFDIFKGNRTLYHVDKIVRETGEPVDDGLRAVFVNTKIKEDTKVSRLMSNFLEEEVDDPEFPELSSRVNYLKHEEKGVASMCNVMDAYVKDVLDSYVKERSELLAQLEQANTRAEQANTRAEQAKMETEQVIAENKVLREKLERLTEDAGSNAN